MKQFIEKASHLIEALPYIRRFYGKTFVIKCGGAAMTNPAKMQSMMEDIALLYFCGIRPVVIHGGGPEISSMCKRLEISTQFSHGQRVTDAATMEVVQMVMVGKTNGSLVTALNQLGVKAVGISGQDAGFLQAEKFTGEGHVDLGLVGNIIGVDTTLITALHTSNFVPVIAPISVDQQGQTYNVNADTAAGAIAGALSAEKLIMLSDVNGLYTDVNEPKTRLNTISTDQVHHWLNAGNISGGMIPKLQACLHALTQGVPRAHLLDGTMPHSLLLEIFTDQGVGTLVTQ